MSHADTDVPVHEALTDAIHYGTTILEALRRYRDAAERHAEFCAEGMGAGNLMASGGYSAANGAAIDSANAILAVTAAMRAMGLPVDEVA